MNSNTAFISIIVLATAGTALAVPSQNNVTQLNSPYTISSGDFLETAGATVSGTGNFTREPMQGLAALNDGLYGPQGGANANPGLGAFSAGAGDSVVISFPQTNGVTLNSLVSTAAWDGARASQAFQLEYQSTVLPGVWHRLASVTHNPGAQGANNTNTQSTITDSTGTLGTNISQIRFNYADTDFWGWNGYREIDATGAASAAPVGPKVMNSIQIGELYTPASNDLLQTTSITTTNSSGNFNDEGSAGIAALTNGVFGPGGGGGNGQSSSASGNGGEFITFGLDLLASPGGYSISGIDVYAGWDGFRGGQAYELLYSVVSAPNTFVSLGTVSLDATSTNAPGGDVNTRSMMRDADGQLATDVAAVRIAFNDVTFGFAGYREIDVFGTPIPEPTTALFGVLGALIFLRRRR